MIVFGLWCWCRCVSDSASFDFLRFAATHHITLVDADSGTVLFQEPNAIRIRPGMFPARMQPFMEQVHRLAIVRYRI